MEPVFKLAYTRQGRSRTHGETQTTVDAKLAYIRLEEEPITKDRVQRLMSKWDSITDEKQKEGDTYKTAATIATHGTSEGGC